MPRYYVHNLETDKLNIFTGGKADWLSIPEADRERIKSACLWSRSINGWVSRAKGGMSRFYAEEVLKRNGFEDRGTEGERLSFVEQVEAKRERADARAERYEDRAGTAEAKGNALYKRAHQLADCIPTGQPILVGHHSEGPDRRFRARIHNMFGKAFAEGDKAKHYASRAATARATAEGAQYSDPGYLGRRIKECMAEIGILERYLSGKRFGTEEAERRNAISCGDSPDRDVTEADQERWTNLLNEEIDKLEFLQHCLETCGKPVFNKSTLGGKTAVKIKGRWELIVKLNPTTVAVPNTVFPLEADQRKYAFKYAYTDVQDAR